MEQKSILLVEDDENDETLTRRALEKSGIKADLHVARDGVAALDFLFCTGEYADRDPKLSPQFVLLDLKLPKIDGFEVLRRIRADDRTRLLPVIILTSSREDGDLIASYLGRANSYIVKPVDSDSFSECIRQMGAYWGSVNEFLPNGS
jgi:two-component system response regulator